MFRTHNLFVCAIFLPIGEVAHAATFTVNSTIDAVDAHPGDGVCATVTHVCTLRAAIQETNALAGADTINLPAGTFTLSLAGVGEDAAATGDLDITDDLTLTGAGVASTLIDGGGLDRVFDIFRVGVPNAPQVTITAVTIQRGTAGNGAASRGGFGGGIFGTATLRNTILAYNINFIASNCVGTMTDDGYNLSSDDSCALSALTSLSNTDPLLLPLQNNGGPTDTQALCTSLGEPVAACPGKSPAIDAIPPGINGCGTAIPTDQRGIPHPQGVGCDLGAFEATDVFLPFAAFEAKVILFRSTQVRNPQSKDAFLALGSFTLGTASKGIKPLTEPVVFTLADTDGHFFKQTLPPGSFQSFGRGGFLFRAPTGKPGIRSPLLQPTKRAGRFIFLVQGEKLDLRGAGHPLVTVSLQIGDDTGAEALPCRKFSQGLLCQ